MALYNLARMTTTTAGTGTITLGSAVGGFLSFAGSGVPDGTTVTYAIQDGANSEIGRGVYTASGTTLTRTVLKSTNSDAAISLSGTAQVFITPAAEDLALYALAADVGANNGIASLDGTGKLSASQIPDALAGALQFQGEWNAATNTPTLADGTGTTGHMYRVSVEGTTSLDGNASWSVGDELYFDGTVWDDVANASASGSSGNVGLLATDNASVAGFAQTNGHGGDNWRAHWTEDQTSIVIYGDVALLGHDSADNWGPFCVPWDSATNGDIEAMYAGTNYLLIQTDATTGNLWHMGLTDTGQGGLGATSGTTLFPAQITQFVSDAVKISSVTTEASMGDVVDKFWFAVTSTGTLYSCGYSGVEHTQGYNNTVNLSTPRQMTYSDGTTPITSVAQVYCAESYSPIWARLTTGAAVRWGAGSDGAHGNNDTVAMAWPDALETTHGSGTDRTDIASIAVSGSTLAPDTAVTWLLTTGGKIEAAGGQDYGIGDAAALGATDALTFQAAAGAIDSDTVSSIYAGGGALPVCVAITSTGTGYIVGHVVEGLIGDGSTSSVSTFTAFSGLPSGFSGALTSARIAGANTYSIVYLEATISSAKQLAAIGYGTNYATANGDANITAASRTWKTIKGAFGTVNSWQSVGEYEDYGIELLDSNGRLWYAGANSQGQGGVQPGSLHDITYMQPCMLSGSRIAKAPQHKGAYSAIVEYSYNHEVENDGSTWRYVNTTATTGSTPPTLPTESNTYWQLVSEGASANGVLASSTFSADNRLLRSDGTARSLQDSGITVDDSDNVSGIATLTLPNTGLHLLDTDGSHDVIVKPGSDVTADRTLTISTGDADRALDISASDVTVSTFGASLIDDADDAAARTTLAAEKLGEVGGDNTQTGTTYTLALADKGKRVRMNNAAANILTVPPNATVAFPTNSRIELVQYGAGQTTIAAGAGVTIRSSGGDLLMYGQYSVAVLDKLGTDEWLLVGDLTT